MSTEMRVVHYNVSWSGQSLKIFLASFDSSWFTSAELFWCDILTAALIINRSNRFRSSGLTFYDLLRFPLAQSLQTAFKIV